jgi:hypothetical protein
VSTAHEDNEATTIAADRPNLAAEKMLEMLTGEDRNAGS